MKLLAFDLSSGGVFALAEDAVVCGQRRINDRVHAGVALAAIDALLAEASMVVGDCDAFAFGSGPGSFTGLRVAACLAQGLALAHQRPIHAVPSLQAVAQTVFDCGELSQVMVVQDARQHQVYAASFVCRDGCAQPLYSEVVCDPNDPLLASGATLVGSGVAVYGGLWRERGLSVNDDAALMRPSPQALVTLALQYPPCGIEQAHPRYVRHRVAEVRKGT